MKNILFISVPWDYHAHAAIWGLAQSGIQVDFWSHSEFPINNTATLSVSNTAEPEFRFTDPYSQRCARYDLVWYRRISSARVHPETHPDDASIALRESQKFLGNIIPHLKNQQAILLNDFQHIASADTKFNQLSMAKKAGFRIPATLMSNDPTEVLNFHQKHKGQIVHKSFMPGGWLNDAGDQFILKTSSAASISESDSDAIRLCPGIYQERILNKRDIRVTVFGNDVIAVEIQQQQNSNIIDWRYDTNILNPEVTLIILPDEVIEHCKLVCRLLGLRTGCIDLAVDEYGNFFFIEVNESGQFLWIEHSNPEIPLLHHFCEYLKNLLNIKAPFSKPLSIANFEASAAYQNYETEKEKIQFENKLFASESS